jgi:hypothetical protein
VEEQNPARRVLFAVVEGRRQRDRPKLRWEDGVKEDARKVGGREIGGMLQGTGTAGRSFKRRPGLRMGCCADDDDDAWVAVPYFFFFTLSHKRQDFREKNY